MNNNQLFNNNNNFVSSQQVNNGINNNALGTTNVNGVGTLLTVNQNQQTLNQDQYGTPQGNVITGTNIGGISSNINNFGRGNVDPGLTNSVSSSLTFPTSTQNFNNGNNNLNNFNNGNNLRTINQQSSNNPFLSNSINNNNNFVSGYA